MSIPCRPPSSSSTSSRVLRARRTAAEAAPEATAPFVDAVAELGRPRRRSPPRRSTFPHPATTCIPGAKNQSPAPPFNAPPPFVPFAKAEPAPEPEAEPAEDEVAEVEVDEVVEVVEVAARSPKLTPKSATLPRPSPPARTTPPRTTPPRTKMPSTWRTHAPSVGTPNSSTCAPNSSPPSRRTRPRSAIRTRRVEELAAVRSDLELAQEAARTAEAEIAQRASERDDAEARCTTLAAELTALTDASDAARADADALQTERDEIGVQLDAAQAKIVEVEAQLASAEVGASSGRKRARGIARPSHRTGVQPQRAGGARRRARAHRRPAFLD